MSHDRYFIDQFAERIWELEGGKITDYKGNYSQYKVMKQRLTPQITPAQMTGKKEANKERTPEAAKKRGARNLEKQIARLERDVEKQEELLSEYDDQIQAAATDYTELARLMEEKAAQEEILAGLYEQWETLSAELEEME